MKVWTQGGEKGILHAARKAGVEVQGLREEGRAFRFTLGLTEEKGSRHECNGTHYRLWQRSGFRNNGCGCPSRVASVCFHGHYAFMREIFASDPDARIQSGMTDYRGEENFHYTAMIVGNRNVGSLMSPLCYSDACFCGEREQERAYG